MAGFIDAITGASFKMPDGTVKQQTLTEAATELFTNAGQEATALVETAKESIMTNLLPGLTRVVNKAIPTALAASATKQYMGGQGSFVEFLQPAYLQASFQRLEADKHVYIGHMCHKVLTLSTLSGFTMCENVQLDIPSATVEDLEIITRYLETGVIVE